MFGESRREASTHNVCCELLSTVRDEKKIFLKNGPQIIQDLYGRIPRMIKAIFGGIQFPYSLLFP